MPTGTVVSDANIRIGRFVTDPRSPFSPLRQGASVEVTGFAADPANDEFSYRFRVLVEGESLWTSGDLVEMDPDDEAALPYVPLVEDDPARDLRESLGVRLVSGETVTADEVARLAHFLAIDIELAGNWNGDQLREALDSLALMRRMGTYVRSEKGWTVTELRTVADAVRGMARGAGLFLEAAGGPRDEVLGFRLLYAPLRITRSAKDNLSPNPANIVWFAKNTNGYEIQLGNKVFFQGRQRSRRNPEQPYDAVQLVAHEIAHVINWRYNLNDAQGRQRDADAFYEATMQETVFEMPDGTRVPLAMNSGFAFAARSGNERYETVTDAIANVSLGAQPTGGGNPAQTALQVEARRLQVTDLMRRVTRWHLEQYGGTDDMRETVAKKGIGSIMRRPLASLCLDALGESLDQQVEKLRTLLNITPKP
jgi:hypothetical protein